MYYMKLGFQNDVLVSTQYIYLCTKPCTQWNVGFKWCTCLYTYIDVLNHVLYETWVSEWCTWKYKYTHWCTALCTLWILFFRTMYLATSLVVSSLKLLFMPSYKSTDFEVSSSETQCLLKGDGGDVVFDEGGGVPAFIFGTDLFFWAARLISVRISWNKIKLNLNYH